MLCPNCEAENRDEAKFCDECGFPLSGAIARAAGAASPAGGSQRRDELPRDAHEFVPAASVVDNDGEGSIVEPVYESPAWEDDSLGSWRLEPKDAPDPIRVGAGENPQDAFDADPFDEAFNDDSWPFGEPDAQDPFEFPASQTQALDVPANDYPPVSTMEGGYAYAGQIPGEGEADEWQADYTAEMPRVDRQRPVARDFRVEPVERRSKRARLVAFIVAGIVVGAAVAALVTFALGFWGGVAVPDVTGMTEADARAVLTDEGFSVRATQVKSDDTEGLVLITDPQAGTRAPEGSEVVVHIATARFVPDVVGKTGDEARVLLAEAGYENVRFDMRKSDGDENVVLDVNPEAGTRAKSNAEIVVTVSEAYRVPNVDGLDAEAAVDAIRDAGLAPEIVYIDTDQFADGAIIGTNPEAGTKVSQGATVSVSVARARGVELVSLTEDMFAAGNTVTVGGVDYEIESVISVSYQGDDTVAFTANGRPKITFFGETLYASSSQTISGQVVWSEDNEVVSIY